MGSQDTEITLGTGKMLALFFGLVALCGLFFGLGFSLGRGSVRPMAASDAAQTTTGPALRPSAMKSGGAPNQNSGDMTFYKAVQNKDATAPDTPKDDPAKGDTKADATKPTDNDASKSGPPDPMSATSGPGYFVQVAAVSKQDDAQALVDALKKKQYPAFTANTTPSDKLFHVQVGPFADLKDAEATKAKLVSDGYNPILKR
ncbi:MAG TPA: SPOR domain-containing protein [Terriglobales bacterium]|jgi:DedD protein|nr:SPOR domain-containing protein [Terriglobales bacterium]